MALVEDETSRVQEDVVSLSNPLLALAPDDLLLRMSKALRSLSSPLHPPRNISEICYDFFCCTAN